MSQQKTLQQQRAAQAFTDVDGVKERTQKEYGSLVRSLPAMIQSDGLATSLVFLKAKGKDHHLNANDHISKWVMANVAKQEGDLLTWLLQVDSFKYRQATTEALAYLTWLKRFAEAKGIGSE